MDDTISERFSRQMPISRRAAGLTQDELATLVRSTQRHISYIEAGKRGLRLALAVRIAAVFAARGDTALANILASVSAGATVTR